MSKNKDKSIQIDQDQLKRFNRRAAFFFTAGILFPALTLLAELFLKLSAELFLDPIPTIFHILLVGFVPLANFQMFWALLKGNVQRTTLLGWTSAISAGVCLFYSLVFLPVSHISALGLLVLLGILGFAPIVSLWMTLLMRYYFKKVTGIKSFIFKWPGVLVGFLIALAIIGLSESRFLITKHGLELANSSKVEEQKRGLSLLKKYGDNQYLQNLTQKYKNNLYVSDNLYSLIYSKEGNSFDFFSDSPADQRDRVKEIFYRLNGETVDQFESRRNISKFGKDEDLSLFSSEMVGSIDNDASLGYLEWTFEFKNKSEFGQAEAIGQVQLPPDSVVSRLTLWVNGEEREAAFAERNKVSEAYEEVVSSKRDPVLVTTSGKDRIEMKCFPVPPKGGKMKVKIGITFPLILDENKNGFLKLPFFREDNFVVSNDFQHNFLFLSTGKLETNYEGLKFEPEGRFFVLKGKVPDGSIITGKSSIKAISSNEKNAVWAFYDNTYIKQEIIETTTEKPARFVFVIDTSGVLKPEKERIISTIKNLPENIEIGLVLTHGNGLNQEISNPRTFIGNPNSIAEKIKMAEFGGGTDNLPALVKAWDLAREVDTGVVLWIHSPQTYMFKGSELQAEKLIRRSNQTEIYNFTLGKGQDVIENRLKELNFLKNVPHLSGLEKDVENLLEKLNQQRGSLKYSRTIDTEAKETVEKKTSKHMIRLWAFDEINEILATEKDERTAIDLAVRYQLVTPVTGAVVLENQEQYDKAGLQPVRKNVVHAVPEAETWVLMIIGLILVIWTIKRHRSVI